MKGSKVVYLHHYSTGDLWHNYDAENAYPLKGIIYTGKVGKVWEKNEGESCERACSSIQK